MAKRQGAAAPGSPAAVAELLRSRAYLADRGLATAVYLGLTLDQPLLLEGEAGVGKTEVVRFEAFLLELLSDFQITIPEIGTIAAGRPPLVVLTSNRTRELHDALKRRCLYHWIGYPELEREVEIVRLRAPGLPEPLVREVVAIVGRLRELDLVKAPGVAETINWARALGLLGVDRLDPDAVAPTLGSVLKDRDDLLRVHAGLEELLAHGAR